MITRRKLLIASPALILPRSARAQLTQTGAGKIGSGGGTTPTTWDPGARGAGAALSNGNLTATATSTTAATVQTTTSYSTGKKYCELTWSGTTNLSSWTFYLMRSTASFPAGYVYCNPSTNWAINTIGGPTNSTDITSGGPTTTVGVAIDFVNSRAWIHSTIQSPWNKDGTADPVGNVGGADFSAALSGGAPFFGGANLGGDVTGIVVVANFGTTPGAVSAGNGTWVLTPPTGYTNW